MPKLARSRGQTIQSPSCWCPSQSSPHGVMLTVDLDLVGLPVVSALARRCPTQRRLRETARWLRVRAIDLVLFPFTPSIYEMRANQVLGLLGGGGRISRIELISWTQSMHWSPGCIGVGRHQRTTAQSVAVLGHRPRPLRTTNPLSGVSETYGIFGPT